MGSRIGQSLLDTKVLVRLNILVERISFRPSISRETRATDWPEILIDHQSIQPVKPFADGFQISAFVFEPEHYPRFLEACISRLISTAGAEWVIAPTEITSTPVFA